MNFQTILYDCCRKKIFFKNYSCWRINTVKWCVGTQRAIDTTVSERDLFSRGKSLARECLSGYRNTYSAPVFERYFEYLDQLTVFFLEEDMILKITLIIPDVSGTFDLSSKYHADAKSIFSKVNPQIEGGV